MKKLLLGLGTLSLAALPVLALASCSSETKTISGSLNTGEVTTDDQKRTIAAIEYYEISSKNNSDKNILIIALNTTSFSGLLAIDLPNYIITFDSTLGAETITLTPNKGFEFSTKNSLISVIKPEDSLLLGSLKIGEVTSSDIITTIAAIKVYEGSSKADGNKDTLITALNKTSFTSLVSVDVPNFLITYTETPGSETITLTPNKGFKFSTNTSLVSTVNIVIIPGSLNTGEVTTLDQKRTIRAIKDYEESSKNNNDKDTLIVALNTTSFSDLEKGDLPNLVITYNTNTFGSETITLTPNKGFRFSTNTSLVSTIVAVIPGAINARVVTTLDQKTTIRAIKVYEASLKADGDKASLIAALNLKSFSYLVKGELPNFLITYTETPGSETITLTPNKGFKFSTNTSLVSTVNMVVMPGAINSGGATTTEMKTTIAAIKVYEGSSKADGNKDTLITALNKTSFTSLVSVDVPNFLITYTETPGSETITLTPNKGFRFSTNTSLVSKINSYAIQGSLNSGAATTTEMKTTIAAIKIYEADELITPDSGDKTALITALNATSFTGLVVADVPNYKITYTETPGSETITLTPNKGFRFSTGTPLISTAQLVQFTGDILNKSDLMDIGFDSKTTITLEDWKNWAPNVKQLGTQINETETSSTAPFYQNTTLKSIVIPNTIEIIGTQAFRGILFDSITFEGNSNLTTISVNAFKGCHISKSNFTLPDSVTHLYKEAFSGVNLNENQFIINPTSSLTNLGKEVFWNALGISNTIYIPDTVTNIDSLAFNGTTSLTSGFSINSTWRIGNTATYGFNQAQWDNNITWR